MTRINNFYGILEVIEKSDIKIDYYNKLKISFSLQCIDKDNKSIFYLKCEEKIVDEVYSKMREKDNIFVTGNIITNYNSSGVEIVVNNIKLFNM